MIDIVTRIERTLELVAQCHSDRGRMIRKIYLDRVDLAEWRSLGRGMEFRGFEVASGAHPESRVFNKCGQGFQILKDRGPSQ